MRRTFTLQLYDRIDRLGVNVDPHNHKGGRACPVDGCAWGRTTVQRLDDYNVAVTDCTVSVTAGIEIQSGSVVMHEGAEIGVAMHDAPAGGMLVVRLGGEDPGDKCMCGGTRDQHGTPSRTRYVIGLIYTHDFKLRTPWNAA